jgi:ketosteroid isomerase-like protein
LALIAAATALVTGPAARADDLADVRAVLTAETDMFARYDARMARGIFAPDVIWQNPFGVRFHSEADLEKFLTRLFERPGYRSGKDIGAPVITDVRLLAPDVAVAWGEETSQGQIEAGKPLGLRKSHYLDVLRKRGGGWRVTDEMIMDEK